MSSASSARNTPASAMSTLLLAVALTNLTGVVTFAREGMPFYFMTDDAGTPWRIERREATPAARVGDLIAVKGRPERSLKHRLADVELAVTGRGLAPSPRELSVGELIASLLPYGDPSLYGGLFAAQGILRDINRRQTTTQLLVGEGDANLQVEVPWALEEPLPADWTVGATVRVTGSLAYTSIENFDEGISARIENIELIPRSREAVEIVRHAPFWTARRLAALLGGLLALFAIVFVWAVTLRRMVARRTRELADSVRQRESARIEADAARRERLRLAADIHDGFQQYLAGAMFRLKAALNYLPQGAHESRAQLEKVKEALQHTQTGLRSTLWAMNEESEGPESLAGLFAFVARRMAHWEGVVEIRTVGEERKVARAAAGTLLLILQEAVGNAIRHGAASAVEVTIMFAPGELRLTIADNGRGFDTAILREPGHYGLAGMARRVADLGGTMETTSSPDAGTRLVFAIPCRDAYD